MSAATASTASSTSSTSSTNRTGTSDGSNDRHAVWLDCDPGHDDAFAMLLAAYTPSIELLGISTVSGNQTLALTTANALNVLAVSGLEHLPVHPGRHEPLMRRAQVSADIHGASGLDGATFPLHNLKPSRVNAWDAMAAALRDHCTRNGILPADSSAVEAAALTTADSHYSNERGVTLIATGPLSNIAMLLLAHPWTRHCIRQIAIMGGAIGTGNVTPVAEFNIFVDPEAARIVLESGVAVVLCPLELTHQVLANAQIMARISAIATPFAALFVGLLKFFSSSYAQRFGLDAPPLHDPLPVAWVIAPHLFRSKFTRVDIDTQSALGRGQTVCDMYGLSPLRANCRVLLGVDVERFWDLQLAAFGKANAASCLNKESPKQSAAEAATVLQNIEPQVN